MVISTFSEDISAMLMVMEKLWLQSTLMILNAMRNDDMLRISKAIVLSANVKWRYNSLSTAKKIKRHQQEMEEGPT